MLTNIILPGIILMILVFTALVLKKAPALPVVNRILKHFYPDSNMALQFTVQQQFGNQLHHSFISLKAFANSLYIAFNPLQWITGIAKLLCNFGVHDQLKPYEIKRVKIFNYCNAIGVLSVVVRLLYLQCFAAIDYPAVVLAINALPLVVCIAMMICLTLHSYKTATVIFFSCFPPVLATMIFFTNDSGLETYLILFVLLTFFFLHRIKQIIASFSWILVCFLLVTLSGRQQQAFAPDFTLSVINYSGAFVFLFITLYFIKFEVWKYEISIRKKKKELQQLNMVKDKVFSVISHDMRTPIVSAIMLMRALEDGAYSNTEFYELLPQLRSSMEETEDLLGNLLIWARNQIEHTEIAVSNVSIATVAAQTMQSLQRNAAEKNIRLINEVPDSYYALADEKSMQIVLRNLLGNAIKFTANDGCIKIKSVVVNDTTINITVEDNGVGIPYDKQELLLSDNYYTSLGTNKERGTGLGLLICKDLVEKNGGHLLFASEPGCGTSFTFSLPAKQQVYTAAAPSLVLKMAL
jgi:two-component system, sensor histidine kinase and response regulator